MKLGFPQLEQMYSAILCFELWWEPQRMLAGSQLMSHTSFLPSEELVVAPEEQCCSGHLNPSVLSAHLLETSPGAHMVHKLQHCSHNPPLLD